MLEPSNSSFGIRSVEWLRDHGAAGLVDESRVGVLLARGPRQGRSRRCTRCRRSASPRLAAAPAPSRSSTGRRACRRWPTRRSPARACGAQRRSSESRSDPPLLVTTFRSDPSEYPRLVAGVAWINTSRTTISLYAGRLEPSVELPIARSDGGAPAATAASCWRPSTAASSWWTRAADGRRTGTPTRRCATARPRSCATATGATT